jgi:zinc transport system ATP-binding protein
MPEEPAQAAIEYRGVSYSYGRVGEDGRRIMAIDGVSLAVRRGERLGILGPNGGGKSTLLKLTLGLLEPEAGSISIMGMGPRDARRRRVIGYVPQRVEAELSFPVTAAQVVAMSATLEVPAWRGTGGAIAARVAESLRVVGAEGIADRPIGRLSGGQLQRVMIARALAASPQILLLDEPTVGIDVAGQQQFAELLTRLHDGLGLTIVVVSHDIRTVAAGCDRVACLSRTLHYHDSPGGLNPSVLAEVFRHDVAAIFGADIHVHAHPAAACPIEVGISARKGGAGGA